MDAQEAKPPWWLTEEHIPCVCDRLTYVWSPRRLWYWYKRAQHARWERQGY